MPPSSVVEKKLSIPVSTFRFETGTWTYASNSGVPRFRKSAAAETTTVSFECPISNFTQQYGIRLKQVVMIVGIGTADLVAVPSITLSASNLFKATSAAAAAVDASAITATHDAVVTSNVNPRRITATVGTQAFENVGGLINPVTYNVVASFQTAATTVLDMLGAYVIFDAAE